MRKLHVREYQPEDFFKIDALEADRKAREDLSLEAIAEYRKTGGPSCTIVDDEGEIVASCGVAILWAGTGEAWFLGCRDIRKYIRLPRVCREGLAVVRHRHGLKRIQAPINPHRAEALRFARYMGFKFEGRLSKYGPKSADKDMYAWTEE